MAKSRMSDAVPQISRSAGSGLFRSAGRGGWAALALFGVVYLAALALIVAA